MNQHLEAQQVFQKGIQELESQSVDSSQIDLNNIKLPFVLKDKILMTPGMWNGNYYDTDQIIKSFKNTN